MALTHRRQEDSLRGTATKWEASGHSEDKGDGATPVQDPMLAMSSRGLCASPQGVGRGSAPFQADPPDTKPQNRCSASAATSGARAAGHSALPCGKMP
eukprot:CAMPEP_0179098344 /NCGR_PEP_ID=MMETSP0796-20121207/45314_1 /TAXON_ID=73915 /ORGANISM="Pyrodinium bahamense, Strain pbaha01" /LENGTH=97 /DNA_ID=CAMNT_0020796117 /DNA_START=631 /DNA_END=921 /DNA_ORIENTATION=+